MSAGAYLKHMVAIDGIYSKADCIDRIHALAKDFYVECMLDKSLSGQDMDSQSVFIEKIKELKKQGTIIILSAHEPDLIHTLGDRVYTIQKRRLSLYENKPQTMYVIRMRQDERLKPFQEMKKAENGYCVYTDERMLSLEINRLQKEGWHIDKVYEDCKYDKI